MDSKDIDFEQIFSNLDLRPMKQMIVFVLAGKEPPMEEYEIKIRVPKAIIECITPICQHLGVTIEEVLSKMASEGFSQQMKEQMGELGQKKAQQPNPFEGFGIDLSGLQEKMGNLEGLAEKFEQVSKVFNEIITIPQADGAGCSKEPDDSAKDPKDPA